MLCYVTLWWCCTWLIRYIWASDVLACCAVGCSQFCSCRKACRWYDKKWTASKCSVEDVTYLVRVCMPAAFVFKLVHNNICICFIKRCTVNLLFFVASCSFLCTFIEFLNLFVILFLWFAPHKYYDNRILSNISTKSLQLVLLFCFECCVMYKYCCIEVCINKKK